MTFAMLLAAGTAGLGAALIAGRRSLTDPRATPEARERRASRLPKSRCRCAPAARRHQPTLPPPVAVLVLRARPTPSADPEVERFLRTQSAWRWFAVILGSLAAAAAASLDPLGRGALVAPPLFAMVLLLGVLAAQLTVRAPHEGTRTASITVRRTVDHLPRPLTALVAVAAAGLAALLTLTTALGSPDDQGRSGRVLVGRCAPATGSSPRTRTLTALVTPLDPGTSGTHGPWLGAYYSLPLATAVLIGVLGTLLTLRRVARRPPIGNPATCTAGQEETLRAGSARAVVGACGVLICTPLVVVGPVTAAGLLSVCHPAGWTATAWTLLALTPVWGGLLVASAGAALTPGRKSRPEPTAPARG